MDIGIDLTRISRFENKSERFVNTILSDYEKKEFENIALKNRAKYLATHWAIKEAIYKATQDVHYLKYSLLKDEKGKPYIFDCPYLKVSISHEGDYVTAVVIDCR